MPFSEEFIKLILSKKWAIFDYVWELFLSPPKMEKETGRFHL